MKRILIASILSLATLGPGPALADRYCNVPMSEWQPREALQAKLAAQGWNVRRIRNDDGCYEVRATDRDGRRIEAKYDPKTLEMLRIEHGHR